MEVPSFWSVKPWWCQPWSILLTGVTAIGMSWWGLHRWWVTFPLAAVVLLWWGLFLVLVPASAAAADRSTQTESDPPRG
jgi:hypothetical protein